uniref:Uncharacterized protein n=1 Tax=Anguilla anguilla TaxID=7936 RepID=A0A0E9WET1_ANGAN
MVLRRFCVYSIRIQFLPFL